MSNRNYTYIGVYVECGNPLTVNAIAKHGCINVGCIKHHTSMRGPYCYQCGKSTGDFTESQSQPSVDQWQVSETISEALFTASSPNFDEGADIWLPNWDKGETNIDFDEVTALELSPHLRTIHLEAFEAKYADAVQGLIDAYGKDSVTIKWGVVQYTM
jgi:hypothetical protein